MAEKQLGVAPAVDDDAATKGYVDDTTVPQPVGEPAGKIPISQGDDTAVWADPLVQGLTAHDVDGSTTNPVLTGGYAKDGAAPTSVSADGDAVRSWHRRTGALVVEAISLPALAEGAANIGDVDVLTVPLDPFGVNADAASATGSISAKLRSIANAGIPITGAALTALQLIDDPVAVLGTATYTETTTKGMIAGAVRRDADTTAVNTDNEAAPLLVDARGALKVEAFSGETLPVSLATLPALVAGSANIGDVDVASLPGTVAADIAAIKVAVEIIDNAIAGSEMQVDIVSGGGGGTQYTEGDTDATIVGTAAMWEDGSDTLRAVSATKPLPVSEHGVAAFATGQVTPTAAAATLLAARTTRKDVTFFNGTNMTVYIGPATVTTANGFELRAGAGLTVRTTALLQNIVASVTGLAGVVSYIESYDA